MVDEFGFVLPNQRIYYLRLYKLEMPILQLQAQRILFGEPVVQLYGLRKRRGSPRSFNSGVDEKDGPALSFERRVQRPRRDLAPRQSSALVPVHGGHSPCKVRYD